MSSTFLSRPGTATVNDRPTRISDLNWWLIFLLYTFAALLTASTIYTSNLAEWGHADYYTPLLNEITGHYTIFAMVPLLIVLFGKLPIRRDNWFWSVPLHVVISVGFGVVHTLLMFFSRRALYEILDLGTYNYGQMGYRFIMEYHKQFLHYWLVYVVLRVLAHYRQSRTREQRAAALELKTSELQRQLAEVQLEALRSQLNPHFLFNTLNMVSSVMYEDVDRADHMLAALSRMLRMSLEQHVGARVPLRRELEFVRCAVELIEARFKDQVKIDVRCKPEALDALVPNMLLHTLIENAIKHHDREREPVMRVTARIECTGPSLDIHVLDNGPGIADIGKAMNNGVGLSNTRQRLTALYGEKYRFDLENRAEGGLHVHVSLPLEDKTVIQPA